MARIADKSECSRPILGDGGGDGKLRVEVISVWRGLDTIGGENGKGRISLDRAGV